MVGKCILKCVGRLGGLLDFISGEVKKVFNSFLFVEQKIKRQSKTHQLNQTTTTLKGNKYL